MEGVRTTIPQDFILLFSLVLAHIYILIFQFEKEEGFLLSLSL